MFALVLQLLEPGKSLVICQCGEKVVTNQSDYNKATRHAFKKCSIKEAPKNLSCFVCNKTFSRQDFLAKHPHIQMKNSLGPFGPWTDYTIVDSKSHLGTYLRKGSNEEILSICYEQQWALQGLFPGLSIPKEWSDANVEQWNQYGNFHGHSFYSKVKSVHHFFKGFHYIFLSYLDSD